MNIFQTIGIWLSAWSQRLPATQSDIQRIDMKADQLLVGLQALKEQADKSRSEVMVAVISLTATVARLEDKVKELSNGELSPEIAAAFDSLKSSIQAIDDLNVDAPVTGGPAPEPPADPSALDPATPGT